MRLRGGVVSGGEEVVTERAYVREKCRLTTFCVAEQENRDRGGVFHESAVLGRGYRHMMGWKGWTRWGPPSRSWCRSSMSMTSGPRLLLCMYFLKAATLTSGHACTSQEDLEQYLRNKALFRSRLQ